MTEEKRQSFGTNFLHVSRYSNGRRREIPCFRTRSKRTIVRVSSSGRDCMMGDIQQAKNAPRSQSALHSLYHTLALNSAMANVPSDDKMFERPLRFQCSLEKHCRAVGRIRERPSQHDPNVIKKYDAMPLALPDRASG